MHVASRLQIASKLSLRSVLFSMVKSATVANWNKCVTLHLRKFLSHTTFVTLYDFLKKKFEIWRTKRPRTSRRFFVFCFSRLFTKNQLEMEPLCRTAHSKIGHWPLKICHNLQANILLSTGLIEFILIVYHRRFWLTSDRQHNRPHVYHNIALSTRCRQV